MHFLTVNCDKLCMLKQNKYSVLICSVMFMIQLMFVSNCMQHLSCYLPNLQFC